MKKIQLLPFIILFSLICPLTSTAQSPGGVGNTNLTAWFNPDPLALGNCTSWTTTFPTGASAITLTEVAAPYPIVTNTPANNSSNYNNTIHFAGNGIGNNATARVLENIGTLNLLDNRIASSQGTFFAAYYIDDLGSGGQHVVDYRESVGDAIQFRWLSSNVTRYAIGTAGPTTNATRNFADDVLPVVFTASGNRSSATSLMTRERSFDFNTSSSSQAGTGGRIGLVVGARKNGNNTYGGAHRSFIHELIFFNTDLGLVDMIKVESYLAIKYGVTLDPTSTSGGVYAASNTSSAWNINLPYHNDVIGIARDDISLLDQKQSHSFDDSVRIYLGSTLAASNAANSSTFSNDIAYVLMGHNTGANNETAVATAEMPAGQNLVNRIEREWLVQNNNMADTYSIDFTLDNFTNFSANPADIVLLVDDDGNFSNATVFKTGLTFSVSGNVVTVSGIGTTQIPLTSSQYITLATRTIPTPVTLVDFEAHQEQESVRLNWASKQELNFKEYLIESSMDSKEWESLGSVQGEGDDSKYSFIDNNPTYGVNYYRLKMVDIDEQFEYSNEVNVNFSALDKVKIYPNPIRNNTVSIEGKNLRSKRMSISNTLGQTFDFKTISKTILSDDLIELNFSKVPTGLYFIKINNQAYSIIK